jgi:hypothetical protein
MRKQRLVISGLSIVLLGSATPPGFGPSPEPVPEPVPQLGYDMPGLPWSDALTQPPPPPPPPDGGVRILVSLPQQKAWVFDDGKLVDTTPVSTGKKGHSTPVGTFPILQKKVHHRSNKYSNAPMPFMQRLTWTGIAIHAGALPGYPASHGCIRLPRSFAKKLYSLTDFGTKVTITREKPGDAQAALALIEAKVPEREQTELAAR